MDACYQWVISTASSELGQIQEVNESEQQLIRKFLNCDEAVPRIFFASTLDGVAVVMSIPKGWQVEKIVFFVRRLRAKITRGNLDEALEYGSITHPNLDALLFMSKDVFAPNLLKNNTWPESIKKELGSQLHKYLANLTDITYRSKGSTVLYVPMEEISSIESAAKDKELIQLFESALIHWTSQIKEVVNEKDAVEGSDNEGPLSEIQLWKARASDLNSIREQLQREEVKKIVAVLQAAKSTYLDAFLRLSSSIQGRSKVAKNNLKFLSTLKAPCQELSIASPQDIPLILPRILIFIRMMMKVSKYYNTSERLTGLLRKVSNEIINRCRDNISLESIFDGKVDSSVQALQECIYAGNIWKQQCSKILGHPPEEFEAQDSQVFSYDATRVFAEVHAFVQRCKDLLEVCDSQIQFGGRRDETSFPCFGGTKGPEITNSLVGITQSFQKHIDHLRKLSYNILDVKETHWHDDYGAFKVGVKDLEAMMTNVIAGAWSTVKTIEEGVELLEAFSHLAKRDAIQTAVEMKTADLNLLFKESIETIQKDFELQKSRPPIFHNFPSYSGAALWAKSFLDRLNRDKALLDLAYFLPTVPESVEIDTLSQKLRESIEHFINNTFSKWHSSLPGDLTLLLDRTLLRRNSENPRLIESNFDQDLLCVFEEVKQWQLLKFDVSYSAMDIRTQEEDSRVAHESIAAVVNDYNSVMQSLSEEEFRLFRHRIMSLDRRIELGIHKLKWNNFKYVALFARDCEQNLKDLNQTIQNFKAGVSRVFLDCKEISKSLLVNIDTKSVYSKDEFVQSQKNFLYSVRSKILKIHERILSSLCWMYSYFEDYGEDIQKEWQFFVKNVDNKMEEALLDCVRSSLKELNKHISHDELKQSTDKLPLISSNVILGFFNDMHAIALEPSLPEMRRAFMTVATEVVETTLYLKRVPLLLEQKIQARKDEDTDSIEDTSEDYLPESPEPSQSYFAPAESDVDINQLREEIEKRASLVWPFKSDTRLTTILEGLLQPFLDRLDDNYKVIWKPMDRFMRRAKFEDFENHIRKFKGLQKKVQQEEPSSVIFGYIQLDMRPLKQDLALRCNKWQNEFLSNLHSTASSALNTVYEHFAENTKAIMEKPTTIQILVEKLKLIERLHLDTDQIEERFTLLESRFTLLRTFEVNIREDEAERLNNLRQKWSRFRDVIAQSRKKYAKYKDEFRSKLVNRMDHFKRDVASFRDEFLSKAPMTCKPSVERAFEVLSSFKSRLEEYKQIEKNLRTEMDIFSIEQSPQQELRTMTKDIENLEKIWELTKVWNMTWDSLKVKLFYDIDPKPMESQVAKYRKQLGRLGKDIRHWGVWEALKSRVDQFLRLLPLIRELKNPALRERHWRQLNDELGDARRLNPDNSALESIFQLDLENHGEFIFKLSGDASSELNIETKIREIGELWKSVEYEVVPYGAPKDQYWKLSNIEDIFSELEDSMMKISSLKSLPHVVAFETDVTYWERTLSRISEILELLVQVQSRWLHLENIFLGSEEIQAQLPKETASFNSVNVMWKEIMSDLLGNPNVLRSMQNQSLTNLPGMGSKLEEIQHELDSFLETKRNAFPRFYFISDSDLLEILGQQRDPKAIQPYLKQCFEGIHGLKIMPRDNGKGFQAVGMYGSDSEFVSYLHPVVLEGAVENWMQAIEDEMKANIRKSLQKCLQEIEKGTFEEKIEKWISECPGQLLITTMQILWTNSCTKELDGGRVSDIRRVWNERMRKYTELIQKATLNAVDRQKLRALITVENHSKDVIEKLAEYGNELSLDHFEWTRQLRFYWENDSCIVRQANAQLDYDNEYIGNSDRLVITPLTDRCYLTLTSALQLCRGGNPQGPAGTGKTETVKDLGKAIGKYVIVFNCSETMHHRSLGRLFSGLAQTGAWSCLDEFNRIEVEVLSVVAQQISSILDAIAGNKDTFLFQSTDIPLVKTCGIFVTMNPGYAGRSELPDNLKSLLRPISMMVPDSSLIAEVILLSQGFKEGKLLARKVTTLYSLMSQQLSKQDHYDFGLRNIKSVLTAAGAFKRITSDDDEQTILLRACKTMNLPKLVSDDVPLFLAMLGDLFPNIELDSSPRTDLKEAIEKVLERKNLQYNEYMVHKTIELFETKNTRHGVMVVGKTGSGKTTSWVTLAAALTDMTQYPTVNTYIVNPKALTINELYGDYSEVTQEWKEGIVSTIMRKICKTTSQDLKWLVFDGPVDTLWIESMNTVLDDNKVLTLNSNDRIQLTSEVSLLFETDSLAAASPATVSRCGMVFFDNNSLGWHSYLESWLCQRKKYEESVGAPTEQAMNSLKNFCARYLDKALRFRDEECVEIISTTNLNAVKSFCNLFDAVAIVENGLQPHNPEQYMDMLFKYFIFSMIWSVGATVDEESRQRFDILFREFDPQFPSKDTVYEYFVDPSIRAWKSWEEKVPSAWKPDPHLQFHEIVVPTIDIVRHDFLLQSLIRNESSVLVVGNSGTGKTLTVNSVIDSFGQNYSTLNVNFSGRTTAENVQDMIESRMVKKMKETLAPPAGKTLLCFIDDLNMPQPDDFGSQPPLELLRQWLDYGFWYNRANQSQVFITNMQLLCAMGPAGGGRHPISQRLMNHFNVIDVVFPGESQIKTIYGTLLNVKLHASEELKSISEGLVQATQEIYQSVLSNLLPTPSKSHYIFSLRDLSKVFQGLWQADFESFEGEEQFLRLWVHENLRVFQDRLNHPNDKEWLQSLLSEKLLRMFSTKWNSLFKKGETLFGSLLNYDNKYREMTDAHNLRETLKESLDDYNSSIGRRPMHLVLFKDAIEHITRIHRVLKQPRGNALLIGVGGSGRQSLTKLAAFLCEYEVIEIEVTSNYTLEAFHEDLKVLYTKTGIEKRHSVLLYTDTQIPEESFLEDINSMLSSGEIANLFTEEELVGIRESVRQDAQEQGVLDLNDTLFNFFIQRVRDHLHIVFCMSPVGEAFRNRIRTFPALVNCTTIDWFSEWPDTALREVALHLLQNVDLEEIPVQTVADIFGSVHASVCLASEKMLQELHRPNYVTPTSFIELVNGFKSMLKAKRHSISIQANKLRAGLENLQNTKETVQHMSIQLEEQKKEVSKSAKDCEALVLKLFQEQKTVEEQKQKVEARKQRIAKEKESSDKMKMEAEEKLAEAEPGLIKAREALGTLTGKDISELKSYGNPSPEIKLVLSAVMIILKKKPEWDEARKVLGEVGFLRNLQTFDAEEIKDQVLDKVAKYTRKEKFDPQILEKKSNAARGLCMWVIAMENYARTLKMVKPLRENLDRANTILAQNEEKLKEAEEKLENVTAKLNNLQAEHEQSLAEKERLRKKAQETETELNRAQQLVDGLSGERERWSKRIKQYEDDLKHLIGDVLLASSFTNYCGPFNMEYRSNLVGKWKAVLQEHSIKFSISFEPHLFLADPTDIREWNIQGLPTDIFSVENGVIVTNTRRWPLMIDPQGQANRWVKAKEKERLNVVTPNDPKILRVLETAIQGGASVLIEDFQEDVDSVLEPVLSQAVIRKDGVDSIRVGEQYVPYNSKFQLYITTKLQNPHYSPEISTKTAIVNFAVREQGLEEQLLGTVVTLEKPELEEHKSNLVLTVASARKKMKELEDQILSLLTETKDLLKDESLVNTLQNSKSLNNELVEKVENSMHTEKKINALRNQYRECAKRAAVLYFAISDLAIVDPMYQFSLASYVELFKKSIVQSDRPKNDNIRVRISMINRHHTYEVFVTTSRALFEKHKPLFTFHMCVKILCGENKVNIEEYQFLLRGGQVLDKESQLPNPCEWLPAAAWDNIFELDKLPNFHGIALSFEEETMEWYRWFTSEWPEKENLPSEWQVKVDNLQRMIIVRCCRPDRLIFMINSYIEEHMGPQFTEPVVLDISSVLDSSQPDIPLIFVLSPGVDPGDRLQALADENKVALEMHALGKDQGRIAESAIRRGMRNGNWVFLANCHLMISWMSDLEKIVTELSSKEINPNFRLWLSSKPHPKFPISVLQKSLKMTTEPPRGLKSNLYRLYSLISEERFNRTSKPSVYKKLLFSLSFFHSVLLERQKFGSLGMNIPYDFNDADFLVSEDILSLYIEGFENVEWEAVRYLIGEAAYGGRVTEEMDRRILDVFANQLFCPQVIDIPQYKLSVLDSCYIPPDGKLGDYRKYIMNLSNMDNPELFGQHPNADIKSRISSVNGMLSTLLSLTPSQTSEATSGSSEHKVYSLCVQLESNIPDRFDIDVVRSSIEDTMDPLNTVLIQEISRYNELLSTIQSTLSDLKKGIQGLIVMSNSLDQVYHELNDSAVPKQWQTVYPSVKSLGQWIQDLSERIAQLKRWVDGSRPKVFWLGGFSFPSGFLMALLQTTARRDSVSVDSLAWEFTVLSPGESVRQRPRDGAYISGLVLEGASWDSDQRCLREPRPMELETSMPIIHFRPTKAKKKNNRDTYLCPLYIYPSRSRESFVMHVDLKCGKSTPEHWIKRGAALLLSK